MKIANTSFKEKQNVTEFDMKNVTAKKHTETKKDLYFV